jgi:hypothetical protein
MGTHTGAHTHIFANSEEYKTGSKKIKPKNNPNQWNRSEEEKHRF